MITLTKEFRRSLADDDRSYSASAVIILADQTRIELADDEIWSDGFAVEDAVSDDDNFTALGATVINAATLIIDNTHDKYIGYDFMNADVTMSISKTFGEGTEQERTEVVKMGTFRVDDPNYDEATITLSMLDMMEQFDRPYELSSLQFPATLAEIVRDACAICLGSASKLATQTFPHSDYVVQEAPKDRACTFREVIGWAATIAGCFARCNRDGELEIKWFNTAALENASGTDGGQFDSGTPAYTTGDSLDGGTFSPWSTGSEADGGLFTDNIPLHYVGRLYSQKIAVDETVITKVAITVEDDSANAENKTLTFESGTAGYTIQIAGNKFITKTTAQDVCNWLGQQLIGLRFRKCSVTHADDPSIEAGDVGLLYDSRQNEYPILITRMAFEIGGPQTIVCGSETPSRNSATRFTQATKSFVESRKLLKQQKSAYEQALEDLADDIEHNAHGLYAEEIEDPNDPNATIYCLHDKPRLADSDVRIHVSTIGIAVTKNGMAQQPIWYAFRVDGSLIASVIQTIGLFFDYAHGGTLTLGGANNGNGQLRILNANDVQIGEWKNDGIGLHDGTRNFGFKTATVPFVDLYSSGGVFHTEDTFTGSGMLMEDTATGCFDFKSFTSSGFLEIIKLGTQRHTTGHNLTTRLFRQIMCKDENNSNYEYIFNEQFVDGQYQQEIKHHSNSNGELKSNGKMSISKEEVFFSSQNDAASKFTTLKASYEEFLVQCLDGSGSTRKLAYVEIDADGAEISGYKGSTQYSLKFDPTSIKHNNTALAYQSSSSLRYKHAIEYGLTGDRDPHKLLELRVAEFIFNPGHPLQYADMRGKTIPGLIAEDVAEAYPSAAITDPETGQIESWDERRIIPGMLALIQEQHEKLEEQQKQLNEMQAQIKELTELVKKVQDKAVSAFGMALVRR